MSTDTADTAVFANLIADRMKSWPDRDVLTFVTIEPDGSFRDEIRTYADLWRNGQRIAAGLDAEGMRRGEAFGLVMQNHPEFVDVMVGSSIAGTVFVPIDPRTKGDKLAYMLEHAQCRGAVFADYALPYLTEVIDRCPSLEWVWVLNGANVQTPSRLRARGLDDVLGADGPEIEVRVTDPNEPMQMLYTSGTTGDPKAILSPYARFALVAGLGEVLGLREDDRTYTGLSLTHANAQLITLGTTLHMGLRGVFSRKFTKSRLWDITRHYGCTTFNLLGGMTTAIYSEPAKPNDADNPVRFVLSAGMPAAIWRDFEKRFDLDVYEFYGAAEGGLTMNPPGTGPSAASANRHRFWRRRSSTRTTRNVRRTYPARWCSVTPTAAPPASNTSRTRRPRPRRPATGGCVWATSVTWTRTAENAIAEHASVNDVFVYGVKAANGVPGEKDVVAVVVPTPGYQIDPAGLFRHCREVLESNFVPSYIQVMDEIPKTASEKPQERFCFEFFENNPGAVHTEGSVRR
jgi:crotonobetaine/carnitine-CoA ligase